MQDNQIIGLVVGGVFLIGGVLACIFAKPLVRVVSRGQRTMFGQAG